jgi:hypothetical protein
MIAELADDSNKNDGAAAVFDFLDRLSLYMIVELKNTRRGRG